MSAGARKKCAHPGALSAVGSAELDFGTGYRVTYPRVVTDLGVCPGFVGM